LGLSLNVLIFWPQLKRNAKDHVVERRKLEAQYLAFIKTSQRFYRQYILHLDAQGDGIPELRKVAQKVAHPHNVKSSGGYTLAPPMRRPCLLAPAITTSAAKCFPADLSSQVLFSCYETLVRLGDLSRYRETETVEKNRNWGPAKGYYDLAAEIYPSSGIAHNQLAILAREEGDLLRSTYHQYRSLACEEPHPRAQSNLALEFKKIAAAWNKGEPMNPPKSQDGNNTRALVTWFVRLHSMCFKGEEFAQREDMEIEVLSQLTNELKERPLDSILQKIILINLAAEYFAGVQLNAMEPATCNGTAQATAKASEERDRLTRSYFYFLRLNVRTFFHLLQILQSELERLSERDDVTQNGSPAPQLSDKITAVARRVLPALRLYSTWFSKYWFIFQANIAGLSDTLSSVELQELWKAYAGTLTLLASSFSIDKLLQLPEDSYMLEEDAETIGFKPLIPDEITKSQLWYNGGVAKAKWSDVERNHPNIEMLVRVRGLLIDGLALTQMAEAPLDLDGFRFIYREAGVPSELLASPNNRNDASPSMPAEVINIPLFQQDAPVPEDQKSHSVAAPSESAASTTIARESAMNRMVDDLVGTEDNLDPLPEEDENIPPTPPEQTFEDTMVAKNAYGGNTFTISDLVNSVQNYKKPAGSPAPVSPLYAVPMERAASNSSMRQPANLPSIPNGQNNGTSIWNRNYSTTPGPSSPHIPSGFETRGTPINGMRAASPFGHVRGDSSYTVRSNDWTLSSTPPMHRPTPPGLGIGASWGNAPAAAHNAAYGNGYSQNYQGMTDYNLASPLLFGRNSSWNPAYGHSSYGRTPPNAQGG
jgi:hypothetical protein